MKRSFKIFWFQLKYVLLFVNCISFLKCQNLKTSLQNDSSVLKEHITDNYFGKKINDPYRRLEKSEDSLVIDWLKKQDLNKDIIFNQIGGKEKLKAKIKKFNALTGVNVSKLKISKNGYHYYLKKKHTDKVAKLYYQKTFDGKENLLYDPINFKNESDDVYSINYLNPSWDNSKIVLGFTKKGEEFSTLGILDLNTKELTKTALTNTWPSELGGVQWLPDSTGFIYLHIPVIDNTDPEYILNTEAVLYMLNQPTKKKILFSKEKYPQLELNEEDFPIIKIRSNEGDYIFCEIGGATRMADYYYAKVPTSNNFDHLEWRPLYKKEDKVTNFQVNKDELFFLTSKDAPKFKLCKTNLKSPSFINPDVVIEEDEESVIIDFAFANKRLYYVKVKNGVEAKLFSLDQGFEKEIPLPKPSGEIDLSSLGYKNDELWIEIEGWTSKKERYRYDFKSETFILENIVPVLQYNTLDDVVVEEIEVPSHDKVMVPLSIIYKKGAKRDKKNRLLITAYGHYGRSISPYLYPYLLHWVDQGGIYAVAHVRGGGEKGDSWYKAGYKTTKPNTWKDLIACTEYFVQKNYTTPDKIAVWSASAGGITVGRAITERPNLYAAGLIRVGVLNALRSEFRPNGQNNAKEYGTVKDSIEFKALYEMDAYHHIEDGIAYPAVYLTAGINDARVPAWMPGKFAARLQEATSSSKPVLLDVDFEGGHGFDALQEKKDEELANILTFALWQTGHPDFQPE